MEWKRAAYHDHDCYTKGKDGEVQWAVGVYIAVCIPMD